jgi:hypothetical protein
MDAYCAVCDRIRRIHTKVLQIDCFCSCVTHGILIRGAHFPVLIRTLLFIILITRCPNRVVQSLLTQVSCIAVVVVSYVILAVTCFVGWRTVTSAYNTLLRYQKDR